MLLRKPELSMLNLIASGQTTSVERIGEGALYLFCLTAWLAPALANVSLLVMLCCCLFSSRLCITAWSRNPVFWILLSWNLYLLLRLGEYYVVDLENFQRHLEASTDFFKLSLFFLVGWWARGDERKLRILLFTLVVGVFLNTAKRVELNGLLELLVAGGRTGFGVQIPMAALLSSSVIVALVGMQPICTRGIVSSLLWLFGIGLSALIVFYTQTRTTWLTLIIVVPSMLFIRVIAWPSSLTRRTFRIATLAVLVSLVLTGGLQLDLVQHRLNAELETIEAILSGSDVRGDSVGLRYHAFLLGTEYWLQKPWLGWGAGFDVTQLNQAQLPSMLFHLHNTYLEFLVRFGFFGSCILLVGLIWLQLGLWRAYQRERVSAELAITLVALEVVFALWCFTDFQIMRGYCQMFWFALGGLIISLQFPSPQQPSQHLKEAHRSV